MAIFHGLHGNFRASFLVSAVVIWAGSLLMMAVVWFVIRPHRREMRVARASEPVV
jgi:hypothetical protein